MTITDILGLTKIFGGNLDLEKKSFDLNFLNFTIKDVKLSTILGLTKENSNTEKILSEMFIRKEVMWRDYVGETVDFCIESLQDLKQKCDGASEKFTATLRKTDNFFSALCRVWGDQCDIAIKEFMTAKENENISLQVDFGDGHYMRSHDEIPRILGTFRAKALPIVKELTKLLPGDNPMRKEAEEKLNFATNLLIRDYGVQSEQIRDGSYELNEKL